MPKPADPIPPGLRCRNPAFRLSAEARRARRCVAVHGAGRRPSLGRESDPYPFGAVTSASSPVRRSSGAGGQPGIFRSTGTTAAAPSATP